MGLLAGIDIVELDEVEESIRVHANRYLERVFTTEEIAASEQADGKPDPRRLATRFAAKEATMKALRVGGESIPWRSIAVRDERNGGSSLQLAGPARSLARARRVSDLKVSFTHAGPYVAAVVLAWTADTR